MGQVPRPEPEGLDVLAGRINEEHRACVGAQVTWLEHAISAGGLLAEAKTQIPHGKWEAWVEKNFEGSLSTARGYKRIFHRRDQLRERQRVVDLTVRGALKEIAAETVRSRGEMVTDLMEQANRPIRLENPPQRAFSTDVTDESRGEIRQFPQREPQNDVSLPKRREEERRRRVYRLLSNQLRRLSNSFRNVPAEEFAREAPSTQRYAQEVHDWLSAYLEYLESCIDSKS